MSGSILSYGKLLLAFAGLLLLWVPLHVWILLKANVVLETAVWDSVLCNLLLSLVCFGLANLVRYYQLGVRTLLHLIPLSLLLSFAAAWGSEKILLTWIPDGPAYHQLLQGSLLIRTGINFLIVGWFVMLSWIWNYLESSRAEEERRVAIETMAREAELSGLRNQLQPHFLFNSLNSINALTVSRPEEAGRMTRLLSDFLRGTLKQEGKQMRSFAEELEQMKLYLEIEKVRFGHRMNAEIDVQQDTLGCKLPTLLMQPLLENAIKFGLYDTLGEVTISVKAEKEGDGLVVRISNPYDEKLSGKGVGFGLQGVRRRLFLVYGRNDLLKTRDAHGKFIAQLELPQL